MPVIVMNTSYNLLDMSSISLLAINVVIFSLFIVSYLFILCI